MAFLFHFISFFFCFCFFLYFISFQICFFFIFCCYMVGLENYFKGFYVHFMFILCIDSTIIIYRQIHIIRIIVIYVDTMITCFYYFKSSIPSHTLYLKGLVFDFTYNIREVICRLVFAIKILNNVNIKNHY